MAPVFDAFDPFAVLGLGPDASPERIRERFRALARRLHPDRHPNDPSANLRFARIVLAYERALGRGPRRAVHRRPPAPPPPTPPARFECPACGDTFTIDAPCPRCAAPLYDRQREPTPSRAAPRDLDDLIAQLTPRRFVPERAELLRPFVPALAAAALVLEGLAVGSAGLRVVGVALVAFAGVIGAVGLHARTQQRPAWARAT